MLWCFSDGDTVFNMDAGRVTVDAASVTCNDCISPRDQSLLASRLPARECPRVTRRMMLKRRAKRPSMEPRFCLFSMDELEIVCGMEDVEADLNMLWRLKSPLVTVRVDGERDETILEAESGGFA